MSARRAKAFLPRHRTTGRASVRARRKSSSSSSSSSPSSSSLWLRFTTKGTKRTKTSFGLRLLHHYLDVMQEFLRIVENAVLHHVLDPADALCTPRRVVDVQPAGPVEHLEVGDRIL